MLTPVELENIMFRRSYRGYNVKEVLDFKERIQEDYEKLFKENRQLNEHIDELTKKLANYQIMEENLRNAVILAQKTAEEIKITAQQQADIAVRDAVQQGEQVKVRIREEIQAELQNLAVLKNQVQIFKSQFKSFLTSLLDIADRQVDMTELMDNIYKHTPKIDAPADARQEAAASQFQAEDPPALENVKNSGMFGSPEAFLNLNKDRD